jgi:hypothetical protein
MCRKQERPLFPGNELQHELHHGLSIVVVEIAGGLVCQDYCRASQKRSANRDSLHFPSTQFLRVIVSSVQETYTVQKFLGSIGKFPLLSTSDKLRKHDILPDTQVREQIKELKDQADAVSAKQSSIALRQTADISILNKYLPFRRNVDRGS